MHDSTDFRRGHEHTGSDTAQLDVTSRFDRSAHFDSAAHPDDTTADDSANQLTDESDSQPVASTAHVNESTDAHVRVALIPPKAEFVPPSHRETWQGIGSARELNR